MNELVGDYLGIPYRRGRAPAKPHHIEHIEVAMQMELPPQYKEFLAVCDGCFLGTAGIEKDGRWSTPPRNVAMAVPSGMEYEDPEIRVQYMNQVAPWNSMLIGFRTADFLGEDPPPVLPIASCDEDYYICISLQKDDYGMVYLRSRDPEDWEGPLLKPADEVYRCGDSFKEWWTSLRLSTDS
jgi:hypothetical protein